MPSTRRPLTFCCALALASFSALSARAGIPPGMTCTSEPMMLACFAAFRTELRDFHGSQIDAIADEIADEIGTMPHTTYLVTGHASTWRDTSYQTYWTNSLLRADTVIRALQEALLLQHGIGVDRVSFFPVAAADSFPRPGLGSGTQKERALQRRVEIARVAPDPSPPDEACTPMTVGELRQTTFALLGREPASFEPATAFYGWIKEGIDDTLCERIDDVTGSLEARIACIAIERIVGTSLASIDDAHRSEIGLAAGISFAILDGPQAPNRARTSLGALKPAWRDSFREGYTLTRQQLETYASRPDVQASFADVRQRMLCQRSLPQQFSQVFGAVSELVRSEQSGPSDLLITPRCFYPATEQFDLQNRTPTPRCETN